MCLTVLAFKVSERFPFILLHNRDEYRNRPFEPAHFWDENHHLLGGQDFQSKGMWLGVNSDGNFSSITNFRDPMTHNVQAISRGFLVRDFLLQNSSPKDFIHQIEPQFNSMNPFNLLLGSFDSPWYFSSRLKQFTPLTPGIYGLSNAHLDTPWPKVVKIKKELEKVLTNLPGYPIEDWIQSFYHILGDPTLAPTSELPSTGLDPKIELALSSIFISLPHYGTLTSTAVIVDSNQKVSFCEKIQDLSSLKSLQKSETRFELDLR